MSNIRICLIGVGRAGLVHARNISQNIKGADLAAVCDSNSETLQSVAEEFAVPRRFSDFREACADDGIDAVVVVTPARLHCPVSIAAAEHGKHIFLEKPMASTISECHQINEAVSRHRVKLQLGFMRRFDRMFLRAKELLDSGSMGRIMLIKSTGRGPGLPPPWIYDISKSNGILAEVNSHDFDSIRWLVGSEVERVYAEAANFKCIDAKTDWPDFYDNAMASLRFKDQTLGMVDGACPAGYGYDARVEILCEKGLLKIGTTEEHGLTEVGLDGKVKNQSVSSWRNLFREAYLDEMKHFIQSIREDFTPCVNGNDGLKALEIVRAANESILKQKPVCLTEGAEP